jgi:hypothetical protein
MDMTTLPTGYLQWIATGASWNSVDRLAAKAELARRGL